LVENYRQGDKIRQRVVLHVGRKDLLAPHLDALLRFLQADQPNPTWVSTEEVSAPQAWTWGHRFGESGGAADAGAGSGGPGTGRARIRGPQRGAGAV
jgi:hypothetical protein